jgi:hypothetical protein
MRDTKPETFFKLAEKCERASRRRQGDPLLEEVQDALEEAARVVRLLETELHTMTMFERNVRAAVAKLGEP